MNTYRVIIRNGTGSEIYNGLVNAETENEAIMKLLKDDIITLYCDDTLTIEEY